MRLRFSFGKLEYFVIRDPNVANVNETPSGLEQCEIKTKHPATPKSKRSFERFIKSMAR